MTSKVYRTRANDFAVAENCVGKLVAWTPRVEDTSEGGLGSQAFYQDVAKPRFHRRYSYITDDLFKCDDCGLEIKDFFKALMRKQMPAMVESVFRSSSLLSYLRATPSRTESR